MSDSNSTMSARLASVFPDLEPVATVTESPSRRKSIGAFAAVAFVILVVVVALVSGVFGSSGSGYRTAAASTQNVNAALGGVATIEPTLEATIAFPMSGTVASVGVKPGDKVSAGQTLAQLETQSLTQTVDQDTATLAQDQLTLSEALSGQSTGGAGSGSSGAGASGAAGSGIGTASSTTVTSPGASGVELLAMESVSSPQLAAAQQAVLAAQHQVDSAQATAQGAVSAAVSACGGGNLSDPTAQAQCNSAVQTLNSDESAVEAAVQQLSTAENNLESIISQLPSSSTPSGNSGGGASSSGASGRSGFGGTGGASGGAKTAAPSAADLASDQARVDAAFAEVAVAQQALAQATLTTPIAGTVDAVNIVPGQSVSAGSTTATIVVQGSPTYQASTTVSVANIPHVAVGETASVVPDGKHETLSGKVASISIVPNSTTAASTSYLVVVALKHPNKTLGNASTGTVTITTQHAKNTLAVPTSAVTTNGSTSTVEVLDGNTPHQVQVKVGVVGYTWTQITSGLTKGEQVVLANVSQPLPGSATSSSNSSTSTTSPFSRFFGGRGGGLGGGGLGGGAGVRAG